MAQEIISNQQLIFPIQIVTQSSVTMDEFKRVGAMISADPKITLKQIAYHLKTSRSRAFAITKFVEQCGFIKRTKKGATAFTVLIPLIEQPQ
jgi:DNA-binding MarR family transcriptional regulator